MLNYISAMTAADEMSGNELVEVSQLDASVSITAATISAQASDNSFNDSGNGFVAAGFAVGDRVHVVGFTGDVANNLFAGAITALTTGKMTIGGTDGDPIVDDAAGESVTITKWVSRRSTADNAGKPRKTLTASEAIAAGDFVNIHASSGAKVRKADGDDPAKRVSGFAPAAIANGASGTIILPGAVVSGLSGLTPGSIYYLSAAAGAITDTPLSSAGQISQEVGVALSATELAFHPMPPLELS